MPCSLMSERCTYLQNNRQSVRNNNTDKVIVCVCVRDSYSVARVDFFCKAFTTRMWDNAQRDGHPAECRWHPLFNADANYSNAAKTRNPLK